MEEHTQITLDEWTQWKEDIRKKLAETAGNFVHIGYRLKQIRDSGMYDGAEDVFEFAQKEYGLGKSTVSRFIAINKRYSEGGNSLYLKEEFKGFSSSKLSEMLTLPDSDIALITEKTTVKEIRDLKAFDRQEPEAALAETDSECSTPGVNPDSGQTPLDKCLIDFFCDESRRSMLNGIMGCIRKEEYQAAVDLMNPSGQCSHKKGIIFLFLYDYNTGVKYKLLTDPAPVSMTWPQLLEKVYAIYQHCDREDIWVDFYGVQPQKLEAEAHDIDATDLKNQKISESKEGEQTKTTREQKPAVATSQQQPPTKTTSSVAVPTLQTQPKQASEETSVQDTIWNHKEVIPDGMTSPEVGADAQENESSQRTHRIKLVPPFFDDVLSMKKPFELRKNDRNYREGDVLEMMEWADNRHTGRTVMRVVTFLLEGYPGLEQGYCILGMGAADEKNITQRGNG